MDPTRGLFLDIECTPDGGVFGLGVVFGKTFVHESLSRTGIADVLQRAKTIAGEATFMGGHNLIAHDLPILDARFGLGPLAALPVIDTLVLSPIAFPKNPYHRLIKNDRLSPSSRNHPARDCESSRLVLSDAMEALKREGASADGRSRLTLQRWLLGNSSLGLQGCRGIELLFDSLGFPSISEAEALHLWETCTRERACPQAARDQWQALAPDPEGRATLAYVAAWLGVAGAESVVPPWVRHRHPKTASTIRRLRASPCSNPGCTWCSETMSPVRQLTRFFGYPSFRNDPAVAGYPDRSLQEEIVRLAMADTSVLAILPTGGGKSLCFQVPALHRYHTTGGLTIVVTPLQALMKDQVDGLIARTASPCAAALNGLQTPPERAEVRESVRLGTTGILYVSPEQFRNASFRKTILQREIAYWVFDEAHCLSQWGHDFRPDYLYISRFITELASQQGTPVPTVLCMTATAKEDVKTGIVRHFLDGPGVSLTVLDGGTSRHNLEYRIERVSEPEKVARLEALLSERLPGESGAAVVFAATRKRVDTFAQLLASKGWPCAAFHAGIASDEKKAILDNFIGGRLRVIVATNAFGMGIDKPDIRLVVHLDTPGSLENYLQEAGRAGRDQQPAECVLLFNPEDLETQFSLFALARIDKRDIDRIWRAVHRADRGDGQPITLTVSEILDDAQDPASFVAEGEEQRGTKVRTALAVLEKQRFLERDENVVRAIQVRPLISSEDEARTRMEQLNLPASTRELWGAILCSLLAQDDEVPFSLESLAELPGMKALHEQMRRESYERISPYAPVFQVLNQMARPEVGLLSKDVAFSARIRSGRTNVARRRLQAAGERERALLSLLREEEPNPDGWVPLALRRVNQQLVKRGHESLTGDVIRVLHTLANDARKTGLIGEHLDLGYCTHERTQVRVRKTWEEVRTLSDLRLSAASILVELLMEKARPKETGTAAGEGILVEFTEKEALAALSGDLTLNLSDVREPARYLHALLVWLHEEGILELKNGKALISQSMTLRVLETKKGAHRRRFTKGDYAFLSVHYSEKVFQIHVMGEYARVGIERLGAHLRLIQSYFQLGKAAFADRFLGENSEVYERATSIESFRKIVDDLRNPVQQAIVAEAAGSNMLILAGPGTGKTRVVAHRCGYLLRVERIRPERILVVCFNRHAALQLRRTIYKLVGKDASSVIIHTYHGLALRLLGRSLAESEEANAQVNFSLLLEDATQLLLGKADREDAVDDLVRDRILAGFSHILVDEYQDVDEREYAFISALAGRKEADEDRKLAILAVGDDDQSIYGFKGANVAFIRRFQQDYSAREHFLVENYRSTRAILAASNRLIAQNGDRMKVAHSIRVNRTRARDPEGGAFSSLDPVAQGAVQVVSVSDALAQARFIALEVKRLLAIEPSIARSVAVIGRTRETLSYIRSELDDAGLAVDWRGDDEMPVSIFRIREIRDWLRHLAERRTESWTPRETRRELERHRKGLDNNRWWRLLEQIGSELEGEHAETPLEVSYVRDFFVEALVERGRNETFGEGIVVLTAHKAKGLEFSHVFVADGGWRGGRNRQENEEERRVFYVAMTRARETLCVMNLLNARNPFVKDLRGPGILERSVDAPSAKERADPRHYGILHPSEVFLSWPALCSRSSPVHEALRNARTGDRVTLEKRDERVYVCNEAGVALASLSARGRERWVPRIGSIETATITALVYRSEKDEETAAEGVPSARNVTEWEYPVLEIRWRETS